ncbi:MAG: hypothetical protein WCG85_27105 [Polyangia bacterium]
MCLRRVLHYVGVLGLCTCAARVAQVNTQSSATREKPGFEGLYLADPPPELEKDSHESVCVLSALPQGGYLVVTPRGYSIGKLIGGQTGSRFDGAGDAHEVQFLRDGRGRTCVLRDQDGRQHSLARLDEPRFQKMWDQLTSRQVFRVVNRKATMVEVIRILLSSLRDSALRTARLADAHAFKQALGRVLPSSAMERYLTDSDPSAPVAEFAGHNLVQTLDALESEPGVLPDLVERLGHDREILNGAGPVSLPVEEDEWILRTAESIYGGATVMVHGLVAEFRDPAHGGDACQRAVLLPLPKTGVRLRGPNGSIVQADLRRAGLCGESISLPREDDLTPIPAGMRLFLDQNGKAIGLVAIGYMYAMPYVLEGVPEETARRVFRAASEEIQTQSE